MSKHTPGPWKVVKDGDGFYIKQLNDGGDIRAIAEIRKYPPGGGTAEGNAQLIAAVTEMLHALEMVRDADEDCKRDGLQTMPHPARVTIDRAIAKAIGETK